MFFTIVIPLKIFFKVISNYPLKEKKNIDSVVVVLSIKSLEITHCWSN